MEKQMNFSELEYSCKRKKTRREIFLEQMERLVPMKLFCDIIRPFYAVNGNGRQPIPLEKMVKMYLLSQWYNLSDEMTEDLLYENQAVRNYVGLDLTRENAPDRTTLCRFRHLLEKNGLTKRIFDEMNVMFVEKGILLKEGTILDATLIAAPTSTRNKDKSRDPEMSSTQKNNNYHFGLKAATGVDVESGLVHSLAIETAKTPDISAASKVLHGEEKEIFGDAGFAGMESREDIMAIYGAEETVVPKPRKGRQPKPKKRVANVKLQINRRRMKIHRMPECEEKARLKAEERAKSAVRAKVEHPYRILKRVFGFRKTVYRGLKKAEAKLYMLFSLVNIYFVMQKTSYQQKMA
jgi:IS5 family transposase